MALFPRPHNTALSLPEHHESQHLPLTIRLAGSPHWGSGGHWRYPAIFGPHAWIRCKYRQQSPRLICSKRSHLSDKIDQEQTRDGDGGPAAKTTIGGTKTNSSGVSAQGSQDPEPEPPSFPGAVAWTLFRNSAERKSGRASGLRQPQRDGTRLVPPRGHRVDELQPQTALGGSSCCQAQHLVTCVQRTPSQVCNRSQQVRAQSLGLTPWVQMQTPALAT